MVELGLVASRGRVPDIGPVAIMITGPELAKRGEHYRAYFRGDEITLPANVRELAMITTARELDCQFIWNAHAPLGRAAGLSDTLIDNLRDKVAFTDLTAEEAAVVNYGRELLGSNRVTQATFDATLSQFGARGLVELNSLIGC